MKVILNETQLKRILQEISSGEIDERANETNTNPTEKQKEAGNYKMGHISVKGMKIAIENPKGSYRKYKNEDGTNGYNLMKNHYGYFNITKGKDGDAVDVFIGPSIDDFSNVYCVDQNNKEGEFDETKVMLGFTSTKEAKEAYLSNYTPDWRGFRDITCVPLKTFKKWLYRGRKQRQPFAEYVLIQKKKLNEANDIYNRSLDLECPLIDKVFGNGFTIREMLKYNTLQRIQYAMDRLECLGAGKRRYVFALNNSLAIKLTIGEHIWQTKNEYDTAQYLSGRFDLFPRVFWCSPDYSWMIVERVQVATDSDLMRIIGHDTDEIIDFVEWARYTHSKKEQKKNEEYMGLIKTSSFFKKLYNLSNHMSQVVNRNDDPFWMDIHGDGDRDFGIVQRNGQEAIVLLDPGFIKPFNMANGIPRPSMVGEGREVRVGNPEQKQRFDAQVETAEAIIQYVGDIQTKKCWWEKALALLSDDGINTSFNEKALSRAGSNLGYTFYYKKLK